ncbi:MAG: chain-length determining protein, partial [Geobacteraceae bacterium]|nr:chain-length determining protein [Geobacteraceae bacterium]
MADAPINIDAYLSIFTKHKVLFFIIAFTIMTLGVFYTYVVPKKYEASSTVFIEKTVINELVKGIAITPATDASIQALTTAMSSRNLILKAVADVDFNLKSMNDAAIENLIAEIQKNTEIRMADKDIFRVKFRHTDPKVARDYVNSLVRHYIENEVSSKRTGSYDATNFLEQQISSYKEKVVQKESEVSKYKNEKSSVVNVDSGQVFKEINLAQQRLFELQLRRKQLEEEKGYVKNLSDPIRQKLR